MKGWCRQWSRAQATALAATAVDYVAMGIMFQLVGMGYAASTACGALTGGVLNCTANYHWTFAHCGCAPQWIAAKYTAVWAASIALNTQGTVWLAHWLDGESTTSSLPTLIVAKSIVAVVVALAWNYPAQKYVVFRPLRHNTTTER